jgi:hypothetical protein
MAPVIAESLLNQMNESKCDYTFYRGQRVSRFYVKRILWKEQCQRDHKRAMKFAGRVMPLVFLLMASSVVHAYTFVDEVKAVIGEAEGEPQQGKEAVACAIHNRGTLKGVYGLRAPRVANELYSVRTWHDAVIAVYTAQDEAYCNGLIHGAQYWEGTAFKTPLWARKMTLTATIGHQRFYRKD